MQTLDNHKVVLIGEPMVGKTSLMTRLISGYYNTNYKPTIGTGCGTWASSNGHDKTVLNIWDTAGQERYRSLGKIFYQDSEAAILVLSQDIPLEEQCPDSWIKQFRDVAGHSAYIVVAANKADVDKSDTLNIATWAKTRGLQFVETSAKTGRGVFELFQLVACAVGSSRSGTLRLKYTPRSVANNATIEKSSCC